MGSTETGTTSIKIYQLLPLCHAIAGSSLMKRSRPGTYTPLCLNHDAYPRIQRALVNVRDRLDSAKGAQRIDSGKFFLR